ncbi:bacillithiol system redox-active protein YtxJ [Ectobacillus panaciterrae]|uniref:bacillithiol system redox-active protein YtxJ n=1 Tax=Ectobacillus panaciterrae TaxID=363872 RepID=UPI0004189A63|nr:bacillithiol system redox-active protein YtxJ [Ectobacillus panaciterrae]
MNKLETAEQLEKALSENPVCILFKHSLTCPISQGAFQEFQAYMAEQKEVPAFYLYVQDARPLSNEIAERFGIRHESPQVLYVKNGSVIWNESHWNITQKSLQEHINS